MQTIKMQLGEKGVAVSRRQAKSMGICCHCRSRARLSSLVLCITVGSAATWFFFAVQLQAKESRQAPRQVFDSSFPSPFPPSEDTLFTTPMFGGVEVSSTHFASTNRGLDLSEC